MSLASENHIRQDLPQQRSPLHEKLYALGAQMADEAGWQVPLAFSDVDEELTAIRRGAGLTDISAVSKLVVQGQAPEQQRAVFGFVAQPVGTVLPLPSPEPMLSEPAQRYVACLAADEILVITPPGTGPAMAQALVGAAPELTVVDQTSGLVGLLLVGPASPAILSKLCALPLDPGAFPSRRVAQSSLARVHAILVRNDVQHLPAFEIYAGRSLGVYLWDVIVDAGREFGLLPFGRRTHQQLYRGAEEAGDAP